MSPPPEKKKKLFFLWHQWHTLEKNRYDHFGSGYPPRDIKVCVSISHTISHSLPLFCHLAHNNFQTCVTMETLYTGWCVKKKRKEKRRSIVRAEAFQRCLGLEVGGWPPKQTSSRPPEGLRCQVTQT